MKVLGNQIYRFENVEVDTARGCVRRDGDEQYLRQKAFQVLVYLLGQRDRVVSKEELMDTIWYETAVTDDALVQCVMDIRKALDEPSRHPRWLKTIPKVGYRFVAPVEEFCIDSASVVRTEDVTSVELEYEEEITDERRGQGDTEMGRRLPHLRAPFLRHRLVLTIAAAVILIAVLVISYIGQGQLNSKRQLAEVTLPQVPGKRPVAVIYFDDLSNSPELGWLRQGLADMLITDLSRSDKLTVLSRQQLRLLVERTGHKQTDSIELDDALNIARRSRAEVVVLGSFTRLGEKIRIDAQLHDSRNGQLVASESLTADHPEQILSQVDLLSLKLAADLGAATVLDASKNRLADVRTNNLEAYRYYSLAQEKAEGLHHAEAIVLLQRAIVLDPEFAMAYARIGYAYAVTSNLPEKGKPYLERAFQLSHRLTDKDRLYISGWYAIANQDYQGGIRSFQEIISQYPFETEAYYRLSRLLLGEERPEEALAVLKQALVIDPEAGDIYNALGHADFELGREEEAIAAYQQYVGLAPDEPNAHDSLGLGYQWVGKYDLAMAEYNRALRLNPDFEVAAVHLGNVYFQLGRYRAAITQYQRSIQIAPSDPERARGYALIAQVYSVRREVARAEAAAKKCVKYGIFPIWSNFFLARIQRDFQTEEKLKGELEKTLPPERGQRHTRRELYYNLGDLAMKTGRASEALDDFREALRHRAPIYDIDTHEDCLANAYLDLGRLDEAIAEFERILRINPNYPLAHYYLAQAYERKGLSNDARAEYEHFLQIWKDADEDLSEVIAAKRALGKAA